MEEKDEELQTNFVATRWSIWAGGDQGRLLATPWHICANFATCSWDSQSSLCSWEHRLFGGHKSEDIWTIFLKRSAWRMFSLIVYFSLSALFLFSDHCALLYILYGHVWWWSPSFSKTIGWVFEHTKSLLLYSRSRRTLFF